jgi:hypothetical protein
LMRSVLRSGNAVSSAAYPEHFALEDGIRLEVAGTSTNRRKPYEEAGRPGTGGGCVWALPGSEMVARIGDATGELGAGTDSQLVVHP